MTTMRAIVALRYGPPDVLRIEEVPRPTPKPNEVIVKVHATTVNRTDCGTRAASPFFARAFTGIRRPRIAITGSEFAGVVDEVGAEVTEFAVGHEVYGMRTGSNAEYVAVREQGAIAHKPADLSFTDAAAAFDGAIIALTCLRKGGVDSGKRILIHGASGAIGTAAVQLAAHTFGAHVTAVCPTHTVDLVRSLGAERVIDYQTEDFTAIGEQFDVVFDAVGKSSYRRCRHLLLRKGTFVETDLGFGWHVPPLALATRVVGKHRVTLPVPTYSKDNVGVVAEQIEAGKYRPVIDRVFRWDGVVEAATYVETGQKVGNVVLTVIG